MPRSGPARWRTRFWPQTRRRLRPRLEPKPSNEPPPPKGSDPTPNSPSKHPNLPAADLAFDRSPMSGLQFYLRQTIPLPGKNTYRRRAAEGGAAAAAADYEATRLKLVEPAKHAYFDLYLATALRDVVEKQRPSG